MKMSQFETGPHTEASGKLGRQGGQLPETLFWTSLQPSLIFRARQRHLSSYPPSKILAKGPAPSADGVFPPKAGRTQGRDPLGAQPSSPRNLGTTDLALAATVRTEKVTRWRPRCAQSGGRSYQPLPLPAPASLHGLDVNDTGQGMQSAKPYQMEKMCLQSFQHFIRCVSANSPNPEMLSAVFSYRRDVL